MDDNARPHRTLAVEELLESEDITRMDWPAYSPDLNPIEHVWDALGRRIAARLHHPENTQQLKQMLIEEWVLLPQEMVYQLVLSMRRRCEATIASWSGDRDWHYRVIGAKPCATEDPVEWLMYVKSAEVQISTVRTNYTRAFGDIPCDFEAWSSDGDGCIDLPYGLGGAVTWIISVRLFPETTNDGWDQDRGFRVQILGPRQSAIIQVKLRDSHYVIVPPISGELRKAREWLDRRTGMWMSSPTERDAGQLNSQSDPLLCKLD
ncbi:transposable element Tcb2 transposase [Trichonephila clavipes]|nr:transposable element Tcb2 transposase [Trichonephila clavipes]